MELVFRYALGILGQSKLEIRGHVEGLHFEIDFGAWVALALVYIIRSRNFRFQIAFTYIPLVY